jgi:flagellar motor protein MotB
MEDPMGEYIRFRFTDDMLFYSGLATLTPRAIETVDLVAARLAEEFAGHRIVVEGHTDSDPINNVRFPSNHHLAASRALSVMMRLVDVHGLSHDQVDIAARGEWDPIATNETPEGRAANRRVEILVFSRQVDVE